MAGMCVGPVKMSFAITAAVVHVYQIAVCCCDSSPGISKATASVVD